MIKHCICYSVLGLSHGVPWTRDTSARLATRLVVIAIITALLIAAVLLYSKHRSQVILSVNKGRLHQLRIMLLLYHDQHGTFPEPISKHPNTGELHSWREAVLPYSSIDDLATRFRYSEPWDSPYNLDLVQEHRQLLEEVFACSHKHFTDDRASAPTTSFLAIPAFCSSDRFVVVALSRIDVGVFEPKDLDFATCSISDLWKLRCGPTLLCLDCRYRDADFGGSIISAYSLNELAAALGQPIFTNSRMR